MVDKPPDKWLDRKGRAVLDEKKQGFFVYDDKKGWIVIVEVFEQKRESKFRKIGNLYPRTHDMTPQAVAKAVKSKKMTRRISYEIDPSMSAKLINAINEVSGLSTDGGQVEKVVKSAEQTAKDKELEAFLKKQSGI